MAAAIATRKRPALDGPCFPAAKKRSRYVFGSIYEYKKLGVLGEGTYGKVVQARHRRTGETVAITRAALREAGCLAACRGAPSVAQIRDVAADEATGDLFIVTELVDGPTLSDRLTLTGRFPEAPARAAMRQLLRGVAWVHREGALHRDVKPENVLVGPGGALKICDFGSATPVLPPYLEDRVGTLWYLAPEMLKGSRCYGPPVDMWALGCVMLELLTGEPMFPGVQTKEDLLVEVFQLRDKMDSDGVAAFKGLPPDLSKAAGELLCGLLCFDEGKRLTAAQALNHRWFSESEEAESMGPD
ncbi:unnamed protein product [Miscanthus lutarioriparius]|uniref:[RNA-polymerase]-subunit kinase n=1 Tax=Miscanthus lutarioriparius TaxID=422564 RepID=A0A811N9A9_9POAL|nr:unnamed protein product [Miscanthus lutarioriparius]